MIHPSPTALEEIRKRHERAEAFRALPLYAPGDSEQEHADRATLLTHIAALEAERDAAVQVFVRGRESNDALHTSALHWRERAEKAEAQLATRLPDREAALLYQLRALAITTEKSGIKDGQLWRIRHCALCASRWLAGEEKHDPSCLLSGAATPAPTAALTAFPQPSPNIDAGWPAPQGAEE